MASAGHISNKLGPFAFAQGDTVSYGWRGGRARREIVLKLIMRAIAEGAVLALLAAAKELLLILGRFKFQRRKSGALVRTIAKGLIGAEAARTPEVGLPRLDIDGIGRGLGGFGESIAHIRALKKCRGSGESDGARTRDLRRDRPTL